MTAEKHPQDWSESLENTLTNSQEQSLSLATSGQGAQFELTDFMTAAPYAEAFTERGSSGFFILAVSPDFDK